MANNPFFPGHLLLESTSGDSLVYPDQLFLYFGMVGTQPAPRVLCSSLWENTRVFCSVVLRLWWNWEPGAAEGSLVRERMENPFVLFRSVLSIKNLETRLLRQLKHKCVSGFRKASTWDSVWWLLNKRKTESFLLWKFGRSLCSVFNSHRKKVVSKKVT